MWNHFRGTRTKARKHYVSPDLEKKQTKLFYILAPTNLTLFTMSFLGLCYPENLQNWNWSINESFLTEASIFCLHCLLVFVFGLCPVKWSFFWPFPANYVNWTYNSTCLPKIIWNCLHWCNLCILSQSLLFLKQKNNK